MAEYLVSGYLTISVVKTIEASSEDEARELAENLAAPSLCHQCSGAGDSSAETWELNGFDDSPEDCVQHVEEVDDG